MNTVKAVVTYPDPATLEELAVLRLESLKGTGAGFYAYSEIVRHVQNVLTLEDRAARMRAKAIQTLTEHY